MRSPSVRTAIVGTVLAVITMAAALLFMNPPQCPAGYTQAQVDATGCTVGANIGLGLMILLAIAVEALSLTAALVLFLLRRRRQK